MSPSLLSAAVTAASIVATPPALPSEIQTGYYLSDTETRVSVAIEHRQGRIGLVVIEHNVQPTPQRRLVGSCTASRPAGIGGPTICAARVNEATTEFGFAAIKATQSVALMADPLQGLTVRIGNGDPIALKRAMSDAAPANCHSGFWQAGRALWFLDIDPAKREIVTVSVGASEFMTVPVLENLVTYAPIDDGGNVDLATVRGLYAEYGQAGALYSTNISMILGRQEGCSVDLWGNQPTAYRDIMRLQRPVF